MSFKKLQQIVALLHLNNRWQYDLKTLFFGFKKDGRT